MNTPVSRFLEKAKERREKRRESRGEREMEKLRRRQEKEKYAQLKESGRAADGRAYGGYDSAFGEAGFAAGEHDGNAGGRMTARQKKILGYMREEGPAPEEKEEPLDFSLGEDREKGRSDLHIHGADGADNAEDAERAGSDVFGAPIAVGRFSPKKMVEKLSKAEAEKSMLKEDDFNAVPISAESYQFPPIDLLKRADKTNGNAAETENALRAKAMKLEETLHSFNIDAQVTNVTQGPAVTRYEVHPNSGVKVKGIKNLSDDIALNMEAKSIRIEAPIPGKPAVGIEIENEKINMVTIREIIDSVAFKKSQSKITFAVGKDIAGKAIVADLKSMPHLLIAGSTGSGKSVCINSIIASFLYKASPDEVKLVLIDPKVVELSNYNGIPHLLIPVVTEPAKAAAALNWAVAEMDDRYRKFAEEGVRELASYNKKYPRGAMMRMSCRR